MIDIRQIWNAGRVRRWHMNPDMSMTDDYNDGHAARVARLAIALFDASGFLVRACLMHDDEELFCGDVSGPIKSQQSNAYSKLQEFGERKADEMWQGQRAELTETESRQLKFCDMLDAALWVKHHRPELLLRDGWPEALQHLADEANRLGVWLQVFDKWGKMN